MEKERKVRKIASIVLACIGLALCITAIILNRVGYPEVGRLLEEFTCIIMFQLSYWIGWFAKDNQDRLVEVRNKKEKKEENE